ncbi:MAG: hypothetical protein ACRDU8_07755, partial [Egibacteraceae bacterium]
MADTLSGYGFAEVSQYPGSDFEGIARNTRARTSRASPATPGLGLRGHRPQRLRAAGQRQVLAQPRDGSGQKSSGKLVPTAYVSMFALAQAVADGTLDGIDPALASTTPPPGDSIRKGQPVGGLPAGRSGLPWRRDRPAPEH